MYHILTVTCSYQLCREFDLVRIPYYVLLSKYVITGLSLGLMTESNTNVIDFRDPYNKGFHYFSWLVGLSSAQLQPKVNAGIKMQLLLYPCLVQYLKPDFLYVKNFVTTRILEEQNNCEKRRIKDKAKLLTKVFL